MTFGFSQTDDEHRTATDRGAAAGPDEQRSVDETVSTGIHSAPPLTASERVVTAVAAAADVDPTALQPLYGTLDPDGLDRLVASCSEGGAHSLDLTFEYAGHVVTIDDEGTVDVDPADATEPSGFGGVKPRDGASGSPE